VERAASEKTTVQQKRAWCTDYPWQMERAAQKKTTNQQKRALK